MFKIFWIKHVVIKHLRVSKMEILAQFKNNPAEIRDLNIKLTVIMASGGTNQILLSFLRW